MKMFNVSALLMSLIFAIPAFSQTSTGNGTRSGEYAEYVKVYSAYLPNCPEYPDHTQRNTESNDPLDWINKIAQALWTAQRDATNDFNYNHETAYLRLAAVLDAISTRTRYCRDLRSILSRPIANDSLNAIISLESNISSADEVGKATILFYFAEAAVELTLKAALTVDTSYLVPYADFWSPTNGFYDELNDAGNCRYRCRLPMPRSDQNAFAQNMLVIAADELLLLDKLGYIGTNGIFYIYPATGVAYVPVASKILRSVFDALKTNALIYSKLPAYSRLKMLIDDVRHYETDTNPSPALPIKIQLIHSQIIGIASELKSCRF